MEQIWKRLEIINMSWFIDFPSLVWWVLDGSIGETLVKLSNCLVGDFSSFIQKKYGSNYTFTIVYCNFLLHQSCFNTTAPGSSAQRGRTPQQSEVPSVASAGGALWTPGCFEAKLRPKSGDVSHNYTQLILFLFGAGFGNRFFGHHVTADSTDFLVLFSEHIWFACSVSRTKWSRVRPRSVFR